VRVELLFWPGCPSHPTALAELRATLSQEGVDPRSVIVREVADEPAALALDFAGSPTIRIDGRDVQPAPGEPPALTCRVYRRRDGRYSPTPDPADVRDAVRAATAREGQASLA
jgi:hypothetical protein